MGVFDKNKKLVKRPDDERPFDKNNRVDRKIISLVFISLSVLVVLIAAAILLYFLAIKGI